MPGEGLKGDPSTRAALPVLARLGRVAQGWESPRAGELSAWLQPLPSPAFLR